MSSLSHMGVDMGVVTDSLFDCYKLPIDVEVDILCRLPEEPLVQLKCVSKTWYSVISYVCIPRLSPPSPSAPLSGLIFKREQLKPDRGPRATGLKKFLDFRGWIDEISYAVYRDSFVESVSSILPFEYSPDDIHDCCNGLLLVSNGPMDYYLCNPATRQCIPIPSKPYQSDPSFASLAFDPSRSLDYMIVCFENHPSSAPPVSDSLKMDVFYSRTNKWLNHTVHIGHNIDFSERFRRSIYVGGVLYTLSLPDYLVCFDLEEEYVKARAVKLPDRRPQPRVVSVTPSTPSTVSQLDFLGSLGVSKGHLCYLNQFESEMLAWLFRCKGNESDPWILKHSTDVDKLLWPMIRQVYKATRQRAGYFQDFSSFSPCALHPCSDVFFLANDIVIFTYHPGISKVRPIYQYERNVAVTKCQSQLFPYSRCLVVLSDCGQRHG